MPTRPQPALATRTDNREMVPYLFMATLFLALLVVAALETAFTNLGWLPGVAGLTWLRAHFVTIGVLSEMAFAVIAANVAQGRRRWNVWLGLNAGLLLLLIGIPLINATLLVAGGTLFFVAVVLLFLHVRAVRPPLRLVITGGRPFYAVSLLYLLLGVFLGTGMWLGWGKVIGLPGPKEVHVHTNLWGFTSLLLAGLYIDLYPRFAGRSLAWPRSVSAIFWLMTLGALGLVTGPWLQLNLITTVGLVLHTIATIWLLANMIRPLWATRRRWGPGHWHLFSAYIWFFIPVVVAPLIVSNSESLPVGQVEQQGGPILIYGWILGLAYALVPFLAAQAFLDDGQAQLGGSWFSLLTIHGGAVLYWVGLFLPDQQGLLHGGAFLLWALSLWPIVRPLLRIVGRGLVARNRQSDPLVADPLDG